MAPCCILLHPLWSLSEGKGLKPNVSGCGAPCPRQHHPCSGDLYQFLCVQKLEPLLQSFRAAL